MTATRPAARGAEAEVPVCDVVQCFLRSVVTIYIVIENKTHDIYIVIENKTV